MKTIKLYEWMFPKNKKIKLAWVAVLAFLLAVSLYIRAIPYFKYSKLGLWLQYDDSLSVYWQTQQLYLHGLGYWWKLTPQNTRYLWWWPEGRDFRVTDFPGLAMTGALFYPIFKQFGLRLFDWVGLLPACFGALTALAVALLGWVIGGPLLALLSLLAVSFQQAFLQRSIASFVEKVSPTTFFSTLYLVTYAIAVKEYVKGKRDPKRYFLIGLAGGLALSLSSAYWSGFLGFIGITIIGFIIAPFVVRDVEFLKLMTIYSLGAFLGYLATGWWVTTIWMTKLKYASVGLLLALVTISAIEYFLEVKLGDKARKVWLGVLIALILWIAFVEQHFTVLFRFLPGRYVMMLMPWIRREVDVLAKSVAEHQGIWNAVSVSAAPNLFGLGLLAPLALLHAALLVTSKRRENEAEVIASLPMLALALFGTYLILVNTSVYLLTLVGYMVGLGGALALYWSVKDFLSSRSLNFKKFYHVIVIVIGVVLLIIGIQGGLNFAFNYPVPSFLSAGTSFYTPLFPKTMEFMRGRCKFAVAWWDYGYMLGVVAHATTLVDPLAYNITKIAKVAKALTGTEEDVVTLAKTFFLPANETCIFTYEVFPYVPSTKTIVAIPQAGDFAKSVWMLRIRGLKDSQIFGHYIMYLVIGRDLAGKPVQVVVSSPSALRVTPNGIEVRTLDGRIVLLSAVTNLIPLFNVKKALLYKLIYYGVIKAGYNFDTILPTLKPKSVHFKHLKLLKVFVEDLKDPNTNATVPGVKAVSVVYLYTG